MSSENRCKEGSCEVPLRQKNGSMKEEEASCQLKQCCNKCGHQIKEEKKD